MAQRPGEQPLNQWEKHRVDQLYIRHDLAESTLPPAGTSTQGHDGVLATVVAPLAGGSLVGGSAGLLLPRRHGFQMIRSDATTMRACHATHARQAVGVAQMIEAFAVEHWAVGDRPRSDVRTKMYSGDTDLGWVAIRRVKLRPRPTALRRLGCLCPAQAFNEGQLLARVLPQDTSLCSSLVTASAQPSRDRRPIFRTRRADTLGHVDSYTVGQRPGV
ncbi:MAG: hypothetical protein ACRERD_08680 [Candidatus Binatia bacterium]